MSPSFLLWHPLLTQEGCAFDLTPEEVPFLPEDRAPVVAACLQRLDCPAARQWEIASFCSPYFGRPGAEQWIDRIGRAWRVTARFDEPSQNKHHFRLAPLDVVVPGLVDTSVDFVRPQLDCSVIAHFEGDPEPGKLAAALSRLPFSLLSLHPRVHQLRMDLGALKLPEEEQRVQVVMKSCRELGGKVNWRDAMPLDARYA